MFPQIVGPNVCCLSLYAKGECDPALGAEFVFSVRSKELIVGDVYVRIYNEQPTFPLEVGCSVSFSFFGKKIIALQVTFET